MSYKISLTTEETYILADKMQEITNKKLSRRLFVISLRHFGYKIKDISLIVGVSEKSVTNWIKLFLKGGFDELLELNYKPSFNSKLSPYKDLIKTYKQENPSATLYQLQHYLNERHQVEVEYSWLSRYVKYHELWG